MTDIVDELRDLSTTLERFRSVDEVDEALEAAAAEIELLRSMIKAVEKERDAATAGARDTAKHLARFMTVIGEIYAAANKDMDDDGHR